LSLAQKEFNAARKDFQQVQYTLDHADVIATVVRYFPQYRSQVTAVHSISQIGIDVANIGQELIHSATIPRAYISRPPAQCNEQAAHHTGYA